MTPSDFKHIRTKLLGINQAALGEVLGRSARQIGEYESVRGDAAIPASVAYAMMWLAVFGAEPLSFTDTGVPLPPIRTEKRS